MNDKLILLLNYYMREQRALAKQLREALQERDYRLAARIEKGQYLITQQLQTLRALHNKQAAELDQLGRQIRHLRQIKPALPADAQYYSELLEHYEQQRQKLKAAPVTPVAETSVLQEMMSNLLAGEIKGFELVLSPPARLSLSIRRVRRTAILTLPELMRHRSEYTIRKEHLQKLRKLGFTYYDQKDKLMAVEPLTTADDIKRIMQLWMKITCVIFTPLEVGGAAEIRYFST
ncbi:hypothetical protein HMJ29_18555 [Hymenobacter taeanensis]|uniref:Uncharacterized protein n=1 Tax=Hymenobacter taeanensis TaxID=2735321 RepID=A0A6M6BL14_9BACT|nr:MULTISPECIES: hypothetical protein [Hymenobacter]QJX48806.1 hypothetical protein HMJ29_18555 [Hymenobacter taeanensis]UOQ81686.1 hypothetical protein MUN83_02515 [Hymenobacter sp. 5414T-23]